MSAPDAASRQCPPLERIRVATVENTEVGKRRWELHEVYFPPKFPIKENSDEPLRGAEERLTEAAARTLGARSNDDPVWLLVDGGSPCRMTPAEFVLERVNEGPRYERVARRLNGTCAAKEHSERALAIQQVQEPSRCTLHGVETMRERPLPAALLPQKPCEEPNCRVASSVQGGTLPGGASVLSVIVTWLYPTEDDRCSWKYDNFHTVFVQTREGQPFVRIDDIDVLLGALTDDGGLRAVIGDEPWRTTLIPITPSGRPGKAITWETHAVNEEYSAPTSLAPDCGP